MSRNNKIVYFIFAVLFFITTDVYFSELILNKIRFEFHPNPIFDLIFVKNTGAAFSILENYKLFLIIFAVVAIFIILRYLYRYLDKFSTMAVLWTAMLIAGITCNLYERISFGYVRDFFKLNLIDFPVFNISDMFINIAVLAIIIIIVKNKYLKK